jgi:amino acid transporter
MQENLLLELLVAGVLVIVTFAIHAVGIILLSRTVRHEAREERERHISPASVEGITIVVVIVLGIFALHAIEIGLYAFVYGGLGAVPDLRDAIYFSAMTYGTLGYNDDLIDPAWRLVAAIEGINGLLLIGWSTAFFVTMMGKMIR